MSEPGIFRVAIDAIILNKNNQVLVTQRSLKRDHHPGEWETIAGRVDQGETMEQALKREVLEEVNIKVEVLKPFRTFHFFRGSDRVEHLGVNFLCQYKAGEVKVDGVEEVDYKWLSLQGAIELVKDSSIKEALIMAEQLVENEDY